MKKFLSYLLVLLTLVNSITPAFAATTYTDSTEHIDYIEHSDEYDGTLVYAEIGSEFKVTIPKHITLDGATKTGTYNVLVEGDIAGNEYVKVVPETYFLLYSKNKNSIPATVSQDRTGWSYSDFGTKANGLIETEGMTAGAWNGTFYFNIKLESSVSLDNTTTGGTNNPDSGEESTPVVDANNVTGAQKEQLLNALEESGRVEEADDIDTMINIKTPDNTLNGIENITIDTTGVANPGDTVVIVQEKENEWDYISTETVTNNNEVKVPIKSTRPVSFVQTQPDGTVHVHKYTEDIIKEPSCTEDGTLSMLCECFKEYTFTIPAEHNLEVVEKKDENGELINRYYECTNCAYSILNLTNLFAGSELEHDCNNYLVSKYNSTNHWTECSICGTKNTTNQHTFTRTWYQGYESCAYNNFATDVCTDCGYNKTYRKPCVWDGTSYYIYSSQTHYSHMRRCSNCKSVIDNEYYYNGTLYNCSTSYSRERCYYYENGTKILADCQTNGKSCEVCKQTFTTKHLTKWNMNASSTMSPDGLTYTYTNDLICISCNKVFATSTSTVTNWFENGEWHSKFVSVNTINEGNSFVSATSDSSATSSWFKDVNFTSKTEKINGKEVVTITTTRTLNTKNISGTSLSDYQGINIKGDDGRTYWFCISSAKNMVPEFNKPTIKEIKQTSLNTINGWSTGIELTINGTEDHAKYVNYSLAETGKGVINSGKISVENNNYSISFIPDIEANETGKTFVLTISDAFGNTTSKEFTISKTDKKAPTINSPSESNKEWSQTKDMTFTAIDEGIGNVKIAFNNINEYVDMDKSGTKYTKEYQFSGDVYGSIQAAIYYTDAAGNVATQFVKVYNLDNTAPTISNVTVNGKQITVTANDLNKQLNMEGSGVSKYALTWTSAPPQDSDWQDSNILNVSTNGTYYIWVKDAVGNISECYQVRIIL